MTALLNQDGSRCYLRDKMEVPLRRSLVMLSFLVDTSFGQLRELPLGSGPQIPECVVGMRKFVLLISELTLTG